MNRILGHVQGNVIAYLALFIALGGSSYAAVNLPAGSVGERQLRNHSIDPVKLNPKFIAGSVRAWAIVGSGGKVIAGGGGPMTSAPPTPGSYELRWKDRLPANCSTVATVDGNHSSPTERVVTPGNPSVPVTAGYTVADTSRTGSARSVTFVTTFNQSGQLVPLGFDVVVTC
jgi:hypothetical protein